MKRLQAAIIAAALGLGSVPAHAQTTLGRVSLQTTVSAPSPLPLLAPAVGGVLGVQGVLPTPSLIQPSLAPLVSAVAAPVPAAAPAGAPARRAAPLETLRAAVADLSPLAGSAFDGSLMPAAAAPAEPPVAPRSAATLRAKALERYRSARGETPLQNSFSKAMFITTMGAVTLPIAWGAAPAFKIAYALPYAAFLMAAVALPAAIGASVLYRLRGRPHVSRSARARLAATAGGVLIGVALALTPYIATGPTVQRVESYLDSSRNASDQKHARWIHGGAVEDEAIEVLSQNTIGREILDRLRDRGGVIRLPTFFVSRQFDAVASHENFYGGVYLEEGNITSRGWTVDQFLADPALQRRLIREMDSTILHELVHAVQGRRAPWKTSFSVSSIEEEQEAWLYQTLYLIAHLESSSKWNAYSHLWQIVDAASSLDGFIKGISGMYPDRKPVGDPYFEAFLAEQRARWPVFRVRIYQILAARAQHAPMAKMYMDKAKAAAQEAGLPEPGPLSLPR